MEKEKKKEENGKTELQIYFEEKKKQKEANRASK